MIGHFLRWKCERIKDVDKIFRFLFQLFYKLHRVFGIAHLEKIHILYYKQQRTVLKKADGKPFASLCGQFQQLLHIIGRKRQLRILLTCASDGKSIVKGFRISIIGILVSFKLRCHNRITQRKAVPAHDNDAVKYGFVRNVRITVLVFRYMLLL